MWPGAVCFGVLSLPSENSLDGEVRCLGRSLQEKYHYILNAHGFSPGCLPTWLGLGVSRETQALRKRIQTEGAKSLDVFREGRGNSGWDAGPGCTRQLAVPV